MRFWREHLRPHGRAPPQTLHIPGWCGCTGYEPTAPPLIVMAIRRIPATLDMVEARQKRRLLAHSRHPE